MTSRRIISRLIPPVALSQREITRFLRQRSRIVGVLLTPLLFWLVLGFGFGDSFKTIQSGVEVSYLEYFFPGIITLVILFTAVFSNISLIEDRNAGFLQNVLIAPIGSLSIVAGKIGGGVLIASFQGLILYFIAPLAGINLHIVSFIMFLIGCIVTAGALSALGFVLAWKLNSIQGFHAVMSVGLIPLWLLSGAVFPIEGASRIFRYLVLVNPIGYGVQVLKTSLYAESSGDIFQKEFLVSFGVIAVFLIVIVLFAAFTVHKDRTG